MLDIIIPTYKNKEGLRRTLSSINKECLSQIRVTVVDDCSSLNYKDIEETFPFITMIYNGENSGPGLTRQKGIEFTKEPYIMFVDTGDYFISNEVQPMILKTIEENPNIEMFFWQYKYKDKISKNSNNRLHGRVYKRNFLEKYQISFSAAGSYANEDIGFNRACRRIIEEKRLHSLFFEEPVLIYDVNESSITNQDNRAFFYRQQNRGLALNTFHEIEILEKNNVSKNTILDEINTIMSSMYYSFLCTMYERPEYKDISWEGAKLFYDKYFAMYPGNTPEKVQAIYSQFVKPIYNRSKKWKNFKSINFSRFLHDLQTYPTPPSWYSNV